jgi:hypothetical protein
MVSEGREGATPEHVWNFFLLKLVTLVMDTMPVESSSAFPAIININVIKLVR